MYILTTFLDFIIFVVMLSLSAIRAGAIFLIAVGVCNSIGDGCSFAHCLQ